MLFMPFTDLQKSLSTLIGATVEIADSGELPGDAVVRLQFSDGSMLLAHYWRIITQDRATLSSFDHGQKYCLAAPINAIEQLQRILGRNPLDWARFEPVRSGEEDQLRRAATPKEGVSGSTGASLMQSATRLHRPF